MAYNPYMQYGNPYYPQTPYQPMQTQPMMSQPSNMMAQTAQTINVVEVSSDGEANGYLVAPGATVLLWNKAAKKFCLKSRDANGTPYPMRIMPYTEEGEPQQQETTAGISRNEYDQLVQKVNELEKKLNGKEVEKDG